MLTSEQGCWHDDGNLLATDGRNEGGPERDFSLAEADVSTDEPVHWTSRAEILERRIDGCQLVVGFLVREAGAELVICARANRQAGGFAQLPFGGDFDQFTCNLADAAFHSRLARLPVAAAEAIKIDRGFLRSIARQQIHVLDGQEQFVAAGVMDFEAVVRRASSLDSLQPREATDAVIDMHDQVARCEAGGFGDKIRRPASRTAWANEPIAKDILLADDRGIFGLEAGFDPQHDERHRRFRKSKRLRPVVDETKILELVIGQNMAHAVARALAP